jgi:hypothetical protein
VRHLRHFGRFEMNKHDVDRQREDRILVAEKEVENHLVGLYVLPRRLNVRVDGLSFIFKESFVRITRGNSSSNSTKNVVQWPAIKTSHHFSVTSKSKCVINASMTLTFK